MMIMFEWCWTGVKLTNNNKNCIFFLLGSEKELRSIKPAKHKFYLRLITNEIPFLFFSLIVSASANFVFKYYYENPLDVFNPIVNFV